MKLVRLVYASKIQVDSADSSVLVKIHEASQKNNLKADITGMLFFGNDYFVQCLEGGRDVVSKVFGKISNDRRHSEITLLSFEEISEREFSNWAMKMVLLTDANKEIIKKFSTSDDFNPYAMSAESAYLFLHAMAQTRS